MVVVVVVVDVVGNGFAALKLRPGVLLVILSLDTGVPAPFFPEFLHSAMITTSLVDSLTFHCCKLKVPWDLQQAIHRSILRHVIRGWTLGIAWKGSVL